MRLMVTGLGMVSALGRDVIGSCAALRAGLTRPAAIEHARLLSDEGEEVPLVGYPMRGYTDGFAFAGLWMRLALGSFDDLLRYGSLPGAADAGFWRRTGLTLVTPWMDPERFPEPEDYGLSPLAETLGLPLLRSLGVPITPGLLTIASAGHAGAASALWTGVQALESGGLDRLVVLAVDSYLDSYTLEWLAESNRLKTEENPVGLVPGEAGAAFLVETEAAARTRGARAHAVVTGVAVGMEPYNFFSDDVNTGRAMAEAIAGALVGEPLVGDLVCDLNGEPWRAYELACAQVRLGEQLSGVAEVLVPAGGLGEIGAASGPAAVCVAVRALERGYASAEQVLVVSSSEHGHIGAIRLERA